MKIGNLEVTYEPRNPKLDERTEAAFLFRQVGKRVMDAFEYFMADGSVHYVFASHDDGLVVTVPQVEGSQGECYFMHPQAAEEIASQLGTS